MPEIVVAIIIFILIIIISIININERYSLFSGGTILELVQRQTPFRAGAWPIIPEEICFSLVKDVLKGEEFLNNNGLVHGDIKGNSYARNHLRLEMMITGLSTLPG